MNLSRRSRSLVVVLVGVALAGCSAAPVASPTPSPTYACMPEAGGEAVPCGPIEYEQSQRRDALYAEAEAVYRRFWAEMRRVELSPTPVLTPELEATTSGAYREMLNELLEQSRGYQRVSEEEPQLAWVKRLPGLSRSGSIVALRTCSENGQTLYANPEGPATEGLTGQHRLFFSPDGEGGVLRIVDAESMTTSSC